MPWSIEGRGVILMPPIILVKNWVWRLFVQSMSNFIFEQNFIDIPLVGGGFTLSSNLDILLGLDWIVFYVP